MNRAVFLDRDGVLTRALVRDGKAYAPRHARRNGNRRRTRPRPWRD